MTAQKQQSINTDLQGINQLVSEGIIGVTDLVEAMHQRIATLGGVLNHQSPDRTTGLTGFIYRRINQTTNLVTQGIDLAIKTFTPLLPAFKDNPTRQQWLAALNGVIGDHLHATNNPLALAMTWQHQQQTVNPQQVAEQVAHLKGQPLLLIHGLCMNDYLWNRPSHDQSTHDHGQALQQDLALSPIYLRYNTGQAVFDNGQQLAAQLQLFCQQLPADKQLHVLCHSMGGLVMRSAMHVAEQAGDDWSDKLGKVVFLGTPHQGAVLEKTGHLIDYLLSISPYSAPFAKLGQVRSQGIKNLRHGTITHDTITHDTITHDTITHDTITHGTSTGDHQAIQLPAGVNAYALAASTKHTGKQGRQNWLGDGLVSVQSALGEHPKAGREIHFKASHKHTFKQVNHMQLLSDQQVYHTIKSILSS